MKKLKVQMDKIWTAHKVDGKLKIHDQRGFLELVRHLPDTGLELIVRKEKNKRSRDQREYYWAVIVKIIAEWMGEEKDNVNEILKRMFNPKPAKDLSGNSIMVGRSIEKESAKDVERIYEEIRIYFLTEHGVNIPLPNEVNID